MKIEEIERLVDLVSRSQVDELRLDAAGIHLRIRKHPRGPILTHAASTAAFAAPVHAATEPALDLAPGPASPAVPAEEPGIHHITASMVGTFYRAPAPGAEPFVKPGDVIRKGQVVCILEAMKILNEIESDVSGTVVEALASDGQAVEYGQRLFSVRAS